MLCLATPHKVFLHGRLWASIQPLHANDGGLASRASLLRPLIHHPGGGQSYVPPDEKDDRALKEAFDLFRGTITDAAFPPNPKATVR